VESIHGCREKTEASDGEDPRSTETYSGCIALLTELLKAKARHQKASLAKKNIKS
jgi:hypothetical protein